MKDHNVHGAWARLLFQDTEYTEIWWGMVSGWSWTLTFTWGWEGFWVALPIWTLRSSELYHSPQSTELYLVQISLSSPSLSPGPFLAQATHHTCGWSASNYCPNISQFSLRVQSRSLCDLPFLVTTAALPGDLESGLGLPMGCWWIIYIVLTATFNLQFTYSCVLISSHVFKSRLILHSVCWVVIGRLFAYFAQNEFKCGKIPGITRRKIGCFNPKVIAEVWTLSGLHDPDLLISQHSPSDNP